MPVITDCYSLQNLDVMSKTPNNIEKHSPVVYNESNTPAAPSQDSCFQINPSSVHLERLNDDFDSKAASINNNSLHCSSCNFVAKSEGDLKLHSCEEIIWTVFPQKFNCFFCRSQFPTQSQLMDHVVIHSTKKCKTEQIRKSCSVNDNINISSTIPESELYCKHCDFQTTSRKGLSIHIGRAHTSRSKSAYIAKELKCSKCDFLTYNHALFTEHESKSHKDSSQEISCADEKLCCTKCSRKFRYKNCLKDHMISHSSLLKCEFCDFRVASKRLLNLHDRRSIKGNKLFKCNYCQYLCCNKSLLKKHLAETTVPTKHGKTLDGFNDSTSSEEDISQSAFSVDDSVESTHQADESTCNVDSPLQPQQTADMFTNSIGSFKKCNPGESQLAKSIFGKYATKSINLDDNPINNTNRSENYLSSQKVIDSTQFNLTDVTNFPIHEDKHSKSDILVDDIIIKPEIGMCYAVDSIQVDDGSIMTDTANPHCELAPGLNDQIGSTDADNSAASTHGEDATAMFSTGVRDLTESIENVHEHTESVNDTVELTMPGNSKRVRAEFTRKVGDPAKTVKKFRCSAKTVKKFRGPAKTVNKVLVPAITVSEVLDSEITVIEVLDPAMTVNKVLDPAMTVNKVLDPAMIVSEVLDPAMTVNKVLDPAMTVNKVLNPAMTVSEVLDPAMTVNKVLDPAMTVNKVLDPATTFNEVLVPAMTVNKVLDPAMTVSKVLDPATIVNEVIDTAKIVDEVIDPAKIVNEVIDTANDSSNVI